MAKPKNIFDVEDLEKVEAATETKKEADTLDYGVTVSLPSCGQLDFPATVEIRDMMVYDEEVLATSSESGFITALNTMLENITNTSDFKSMCVHDRDFLMLQVWANNYGSTKTVEYTCGKCKNTHTLTLDLAKYDIKELDKRFTKGYFEFTPEKMDTPVKVYLPTVASEMAVSQYRKDNPDDKTSYEVLTMLSLVDYDSPLMPFAQKIKIGKENLLTKDINKIRRFTHTMSFGLPEEIQIKCPTCEAVEKRPFPFMPTDFFSTQVHDDIEEFL